MLAEFVCRAQHVLDLQRGAHGGKGVRHFLAQPTRGKPPARHLEPTVDVVLTVVMKQFHTAAPRLTRLHEQLAAVAHLIRRRSTASPPSLPTQPSASSYPDRPPLRGYRAYRSRVGHHRHGPLTSDARGRAGSLCFALQSHHRLGATMADSASAEAGSSAWHVASGSSPTAGAGHPRVVAGRSRYHWRGGGRLRRCPPQSRPVHAAGVRHQGRGGARGVPGSSAKQNTRPPLNDRPERKPQQDESFVKEHGRKQA